MKTGESSSEEESRRQVALQIETARNVMLLRENMVLAFGMPESHGVDAKWFIPLGDGSPHPHPLPSFQQPREKVKIFDLRPTWLRDLHYQMQVPKPCVGRVGRLNWPTTYPPNIAKWEKDDHGRRRQAALFSVSMIRSNYILKEREEELSELDLPSPSSLMPRQSLLGPPPPPWPTS